MTPFSRRQKETLGTWFAVERRVCLFALGGLAWRVTDTKPDCKCSGRAPQPTEIQRGSFTLQLFFVSLAQSWALVYRVAVVLFHCPGPSQSAKGGGGD